MEDKLYSNEFLHAFELDLAPIDHETIETATRDLLEAVGEDPTRH